MGDELKDAIRKAKNRKAPEADEISAELIKCNDVETIDIIRNLFDKLQAVFHKIGCPPLLP